MNGRTISITINGRVHGLEVEPNVRLMDLLRDKFGLTGAKEGCGVGVCGACTVLVNGQAVSGCLTLAITADGGDVQTIEGVGKEGVLHPVQKAFLDHGALQCGFCTPGQVMAAKAFLDENPNPTDEEIKHAMLGNLCRCTGYYKIIDAIHSAAAEIRSAKGETQR